MKFLPLESEPINRKILGTFKMAMTPCPLPGTQWDFCFGTLLGESGGVLTSKTHEYVSKP